MKDQLIHFLQFTNDNILKEARHIGLSMSKNPEVFIWLIITCTIVLAFIIYFLIKSIRENKQDSRKGWKLYFEMKELNARNETVISKQKENLAKELELKKDLMELSVKNRNEIVNLQNKLVKEREKREESANRNNIEKAELQKRLIREREKREELSIQNTKLNHENQVLKNKVSALESNTEEYKKLEEINARLRTSLNQTRLEIGNKNEEIDNISKQLRRCEAEIESLQKVRGDLQKTIIKKEKELDDIRKILSEKDVEIVKKNEELHNAITIWAEKDRRIAYLENELQEIKKQFELAEKNSNVEELEKERESLIRQLQNANDDRSILKKELDEQTQLANNRGVEIERLREELEVARKKAAFSPERPPQSPPEAEEASSPESLPAKTKGITGTVLIKNETPQKAEGTQKAHIGSDVSKTTRALDEDEDLPIIENQTGKVKRSILQVIDVEDPNEEIIDADEFFRRETAEIERIARMLDEASESKREAYLCACCNKPVKISKRDFGYKEVLFFSHCSHDVSCDWKQEHRIYRNTYAGMDEETDVQTYNYKAKYREVKNLIEKSLKTEKSRSMGISDVEIDKKIKSKHKFLYHRIANISARYKGLDLVIELQTRDMLMNAVVNKDIFYRLNDKHVIWVLGGDEDCYNYINKHVQRNTMFANKRNIFIMDKEAMKECKKRQELVLKCNYLESNGQWHYRKETTGNNGILITLSDLQFDPEMCKPFFKDANEAYFRQHPEKEKEYLDSIVSREKMLKDLQNTWEGQIVERRKKKTIKTSVIELPTDPIFVEKPIKTSTEYDNRFIYSQKGKKGIVDENDHIIIPNEYTDIRTWTKSKYRVKKIDVWGIIDESGKVILDIKYKEIGEFIDSHSLVGTQTEEYFIDENGNRLNDDNILLPNGWYKFRQGNLWGITDTNGEIIVKCIYDEIGSFRGRLIGFINGEFSKLAPRYEYRMTMSCKCDRIVNERALYDINGVKLLDANKSDANIEIIYSNMFITNIVYSKHALFVTKISERNKNTKIGHVDKKNDFELGEVITVNIDKVKGKKIYVTASDGRKTYFTKSILSKDGNNATSYSRGMILKIMKKGYDEDYERTIWEYIG